MHAINKVAIFLLMLCGVTRIAASPTSDLSSPSPAVRADAAKALRSSYKPPPESKWDSLLASLKTGDSMTNVEAILKASGITNKGGGDGGAGRFQIDYRLDDAWLLRCRYHDDWQHPEKETLLDRSLLLSPAYRYVPAPTNFTGVWILYYINGQKCLEINLKNGIRHSDVTGYDFNGNKLYVEHFDPHGEAISWIDYYSSGHVKASGRLDKSERPVGTWTNYNEDGSARNTTKW